MPLIQCNFILPVFLCFVVIFQCLSQHDLVGAQDISHLKQIVFTILSRMHEDKAYKTAYEVRMAYSQLILKMAILKILLVGLGL